MLNKFSSLAPLNKAIVIIFIMGILQAFYNLALPVYLDEAYYWVWALMPDWSYYDHPPMTAWIIWPFTFFGDGVFFLRLPTVICMSVGIYYLFKLTYEMAGEKPAWAVLIAFSIIPATQMGYVFITPDSPLIMFWAAAQYYIYKAVNSSSTKYYIIAGVLTGFTMLSKYAGILLPVSVFIFILIRRRDLLKDWRLYLSLIIAALCVFPIFYWNYLHDFVSISFQYNHGTSDSFSFAGWDFVLFVLGSLLIPTPILAVILIRYLFDKKRWFNNDNMLYLVILTLFPMFFFFYKGFFKKMELNWIIPAFLAGAVIMGIAAVTYNMKRTFKYGCIFAIILSVVLKLSPFLPFPPNLNIADRLLGYKEAGLYLNEIITPEDNVFSDHLTTASLLRFYMPDHRRVYIPVSSRFSQYDIWDKDVDMKNMKGIYLGKDNRIEELNKIFDNQVELIKVLKVRPPNATSKTFYVYRVGY